MKLKRGCVESAKEKLMDQDVEELSYDDGFKFITIIDLTI